MDELEMVKMQKQTEQKAYENLMKIDGDKSQYRQNQSLTLEGALSEIEMDYGLEEGSLLAQGRQFNYNPREYLHNFLLSALHAGCSVESYVINEINTMLDELKR